MAHHLKLAATARVIDEAPMVFYQAQCSCRWTGPVQPFVTEALADAKTHAAIHDAALPEIPAP